LFSLTVFHLDFCVAMKYIQRMTELYAKWLDAVFKTGDRVLLTFPDGEKILWTANLNAAAHGDLGDAAIDEQGRNVAPLNSYHTLAAGKFLEPISVRTLDANEPGIDVDSLSPINHIDDVPFGDLVVATLSDGSLIEFVHNDHEESIGGDSAHTRYTDFSIDNSYASLWVGTRANDGSHDEVEVDDAAANSVAPTNPAPNGGPVDINGDSIVVYSDGTYVVNGVDGSGNRTTSKPLPAFQPPSFSLVMDFPPSELWMYPKDYLVGLDKAGVVGAQFLNAHDLFGHKFHAYDADELKQWVKDFTEVALSKKAWELDEAFWKYSLTYFVTRPATNVKTPEDALELHPVAKRVGVELFFGGAATLVNNPDDDSETTNSIRSFFIN
jgi:hypothetical protein